VSRAVRLILLAACSSLLQPTRAASAPRALPAIEWDRSTLQLVAPGGDYARMARLGDGAIGLAYDREGKLSFRRSTDEGKSWSDPVLVAEDRDCWLTNSELLPLRNGELLYLWNERPRAALKYQDKPAPLGTLTRPLLIRMARSRDHGRSWSAPQTLYTAGPSYQDGCWEPAGIELPDGEIHVYFANEFPYQATSEQEISLIRSRDGGKTWSHAERISMRKTHRDGMPAPLLLAGGRGIVVAIEDNGLSKTDRFKLAIVHTPLDDNWRSGTVDGESPKRRPALAEPLPDEHYAGAPNVRQVASGETLLSYQTSADGTLAAARMVVCVGDPEARNFTNPSQPFADVDAQPGQLWGSLFVRDAQSLAAMATVTIKGQRGVWTIEGRVRRAAP
jgi:hypothetical protein